LAIDQNGNAITTGNADEASVLSIASDGSLQGATGSAFVFIADISNPGYSTIQFTTAITSTMVDENFSFTAGNILTWSNVQFPGNNAIFCLLNSTIYALFVANTANVLGCQVIQFVSIPIGQCHTEVIIICL
jgi:hypothetical protein